MYRILTLNNISSKGLDRFSTEHYQTGDNIDHPDAILCRSADLHEFSFPESVQIVGRAGAGVNNIPVEKLTQLGIPVLNTPGANANAVKELVLTGMLLASRNICDAWDYARNLQGDDESIHHTVEKNKKQFSGFELPNRTLGVIGLGHIGVKVANSAIALDMNVIGFDPAMTVRNAWELSSDVQQAESIEEVLAASDFISLHVPLNAHTKDLINEKRFNLMKKTAVLLNFAREGIIDEPALIRALNENQIYRYVCDFPRQALLKHPKILCLPHLGASTAEAEENCAIMVADQVKSFLQDGHIINSVNFPNLKMPRTEGYRLAIVNSNVPNMVAQMTAKLSAHNINIIDMINKSYEKIAYTLIDINQPISENEIKELKSITGIIRVRVL